MCFALNKDLELCSTKDIVDNTYLQKLNNKKKILSYFFWVFCTMFFTYWVFFTYLKYSLHILSILYLFLNSSILCLSILYLFWVCCTYFVHAVLTLSILYLFWVFFTYFEYSVLILSISTNFKYSVVILSILYLI